MIEAESVQPTAAPPICEPPTRLATLTEARAVIDGLGLLFRRSQLRQAPRGDGRPVLLVPGYMADGHSMVLLARYLRYLGYSIVDWRLGRNRGDVEEDIERLGERVEQASQDLEEAPLTLIGWSLGGVLCREVARLQPERVREVITFGTPIVGGPKYTALARRFVRTKSLDLPALEADIHRRNCLGFRQPVTSIYSKTDGVVGWKASVDSYNPQARNVEVSGSHLGLGVNPQVWTVIAETLSRS